MTPSGIIIVLAAIGIGLHMLFFYHLRRACHEEWMRLGSPNPFLPNDARSGWEITKYVLSGAFERLPHRGVVRLGRVIQYYEWFYIVFFCGFVLLFFYSLVTQ